MTDKETTAGRELVALFADRATFEATVKELLGAGFDRSDLSVLASHESIDAAGRPGKPLGDVLTAMVGEIKYEGPLVASGAIYLAGGPVSATLAAIVGAGVAGAAVKEVLEEVTSTPHTEDFARSLEAGSVILWVRVPDDRAEDRARAILKTNGGANIHLHAP